MGIARLHQLPIKGCTEEHLCLLSTMKKKIEIKYIEDVHKRRVCFSKRRVGLMKKAHELSVLCNAEIGVVVFSATDKIFEFATSSMQQIISRYMMTSGNQPNMARLLEEREEEIRNMKHEVARLELENMSLRKDLEKAISNNVDTTLSLRSAFVKHLNK